MGKDLTGNVGGGGGGNPFAGGNSMVRYEERPAMYEADIFGEKVNFGSEADYLKAKMALQRRMGGARGSASSDDAVGLFNGSFLETAGTGLQTVGAFLAGRNLNDKIDQLDDALDDQAAAREEIEALRQNPSVGILIGPLLRFLDAERAATETAQGALEDQVLAQDLQAGGGVANLVSKFSKGEGGTGTGTGSNIGTIAAVAAGGLGLSALMSNRRNNNNGRGRRRR